MGALERLSRSHMKRQVSDPALLAKLPPDYSLGCKRILPSNHWYPALQAGQRRALHRRPAGDPRALGDRRRRERARGRRAHPRHRLSGQRPAHRAPAPRPRRQADERGVGGNAARVPRHLRPRLPQPVPAAGPQHRARAQLDGVHDRDADRARAAGDRGDGAPRARARSRCARPCTRSSTARSTRACRAPSGRPAARASTSTRPGATACCGRTGRGAFASSRRGFDEQRLRAHRSQARARWRHERRADHHHGRRERHRGRDDGRARAPQARA